MKNSLSILALSAAAGAIAVKLSNAAFLANVPADVVIAFGASLAIVGMTIADYRRYVRPLALPAPVARPALPAAAPRRNAYGVRRQSAIVERTAA